MTKQDMTDRRFGRLIARYPTDRRSHNGSVLWFPISKCWKNVTPISIHAPV